LATLWAALVRVGWKMPALPTSIAGQHGPMISRFSAHSSAWARRGSAQDVAYAAPIFQPGGWPCCWVCREVGRGLIAPIAGLVVVFGYIYHLHPTADVNHGVGQRSGWWAYHLLAGESIIALCRGGRASS
jgi:hypothetical protein